MTITLSIQLLSGETLPVRLDQGLTQRQFYRMIYTWILPEEIRPPAMWQMMLIQDEEWIRPNHKMFHAQEGETLYLLIDPRSYEMEFEYGYVAQEQQEYQDGQEYDVIQFKIRDISSPSWHRQMIYVIQTEPLTFYRQDDVKEIGLSREFSMPRAFNWPIPVKEVKIAPVSQETTIYHRLDILLDGLDLFASAREHLNEQIQQRWYEWICMMDESEQEHIQLQQEWERQQERGMDW